MYYPGSHDSLKIFIIACTSFLFGELTGGLFVYWGFRLKDQLRGYEWESEDSQEEKLL